VPKQESKDRCRPHSQTRLQHSLGKQAELAWHERMMNPVLGGHWKQGPAAPRQTHAPPGIRWQCFRMGPSKDLDPPAVPGSLSLSGQSLCNCIAHFLSEPFPARPFLSWPLHAPLSASSPFHTPVKQSHGSWLAPTARLDRQAQANSLMQSARAFNARAIACTLPLLCDRGTCVPLLCDRGT
jgi:hypothetical protein